MKKINMIILIIGCFVLFTTGCGKTNYPLMQSISNIVKIEVIVMGEIHDPYTKHEYTLIKEVSLKDISKLIKEFRKIECKKGFGDPKVLRSGDIGFRIVYNNGDYELITSYGQGSHSSGKYLSSEGYYSFDKEQFELLIEKYSK